MTDKKFVCAKGSRPTGRNLAIWTMRKQGQKYKEIGDQFGITPQRVLAIFKKIEERDMALLSGLGVTRRTYNVFKRLGISKPEDIGVVPFDKIVDAGGCGEKVIVEIMKVAQQHSVNLCFGRGA